MLNQWSIYTALILLLTTQTAASAGGISSDQITRPQGTVAATASNDELLKMGEQLWQNPSLSKNGKTSCASCHKGNTRMFKKSFLEPYPHYVKMPSKKAKMETITAEGMVQFCMLAPMKADTLAWDSLELAALTAYTEQVVQKAYREKQAEKTK